MDSRFNSYVVAVASVLSVPLFACAEGGKRPERSREGRSPEQMFDRFDKDGDERISKAEAPERMQMHWVKVDTNGDGFVDADEHTALLERHRQRSGEEGARSGENGARRGKGRDPSRSVRRGVRNGEGAAPGAEGEPRKREKRGGCKGRSGNAVLGALDTDVNGMLSEEEIAVADVLLWTLDKNTDGQLSPDELQPARSRRPEGAAGKGHPGKRAAELFDRLDPDGVTPIAKDALPERMQNRFERMDANGDGFLDKNEQAAVLDRINQRPARESGPRGRRPHNDNDPVPFPEL